jgi:predicted dehydrogenase
VNFSFASSPSFQAVVAAAQSGALGKVERVSISCSFAKWPREWQPAGRWLSERVEGGFAREVLSHFVFATQRLTGPLSVTAAKPIYPADGVSAETALTATLAGNGIVVTVDAAVRGTIGDTNEWIITGSKGAMRMRDWYGLERGDGSGGWTPALPGSVDELRATAAARQLDQLAALLDGKPQTLATFDEALAVQRTIEGMLRV